MPLSGYLFGISPATIQISSTAQEIDVIVDNVEIDVEVELQ